MIVVYFLLLVNERRGILRDHGLLRGHDRTQTEKGAIVDLTRVCSFRQMNIRGGISTFYVSHQLL